MCPQSVYTGPRWRNTSTPSCFSLPCLHNPPLPTPHPRGYQKYRVHTCAIKRCVSIKRDAFFLRPCNYLWFTLQAAGLLFMRCFYKRVYLWTKCFHGLYFTCNILKRIQMVQQYFPFICGTRLIPFDLERSSLPCKIFLKLFSGLSREHLTVTHNSCWQHV